MVGGVSGGASRKYPEVSLVVEYDMTAVTVGFTFLEIGIACL